MAFNFNPADIAVLERNYKSRQKPVDTGKGRGGFLSSLISEGGALAGGLKGAAVGSAAGPLGTIVGGGIGSLLGGFGGRLVENKVRDDRDFFDTSSLSEAAKEGAISGVFGAGPIKAGKAALAGGKALLGGGGKLAAKEAAEKAATKSVFSKFAGKDAAKAIDMNASGIKIGDKLRKGVITPDKADELYAFAREGSKKYLPQGVKGGKPLSQAKEAETVFKSVNKALKDKLDEINRPLIVGEADAIAENALAKVELDAAVTGTAKTVKKLTTKIKNMKDPDIKQLEAIRKEADDLAFTSTGAGNTAAAAEARAVRDAIDEFVTPFSTEYKAIKGDYSIAKDLRDLASKNVKATSGSIKSGQNILGALSGTPSATGVKSKIASTIASPPTGGAVGFGSRILAGRSLDMQPQEAQSVESALTDEDLAAMDGEASLLDEAPSQSQERDPFSTEAADEIIKGILANGGSFKDVADYISTVESVQKLRGTGATKPLSSEASKTVSNAQAGLEALTDFEGLIEDDPGAFARTNIPGVGILDKITSGRVSGALGTSGIDAASQQVIDVIARLRTGAAISATEEQRFKKFIPQAGDPANVRLQKIRYLKNQFERVAQRASGSTEIDPSEALTQ